MKKQKVIHPSIERLYAVAAGIGDNTPAKVTRRLNVSAQRLNNWEARGISQVGAVVAQGVYGCSAAWIVTGDGERNSREAAPESQSQLVRLDADMLAETHKACRKFAKRQGKVFSVETDPVRFLQVYLLRVKLPAQLSEDELMEFGATVQTIMTTTQGASNDGRSDGVPTAGTDEQDVAGGSRRGKAGPARRA